MQDYLKDSMRTDRASLVAELEKAGAVFKHKHGDTCLCPFHEDHDPSGNIFQGELGVWRYKCFGCDFKGDYWDIKARNENKTLAELFKEERQPRISAGLRELLPKPLPKKPPAATLQKSEPVSYPTLEALEKAIPNQVLARYTYTSLSGAIELIIFKIATENGGKTFRQASPNGQGYVFRAPPKPWPLYNRSRITKTDTVLVVEGEKCVHALHDYGVVATTSPAGAGKSEYADWTPLAGKNVILWPDHDKPGHKHMAEVEAILAKLEPAPRVSLLNPEELELEEKEDAADYISQLLAYGASGAMVQTELAAALNRAKPRGIAGEVSKQIEDSISGAIKAVPWPWSFLSNDSKSLLPGTVTLLCGSAGASKSFMLLQALAFWLGLDVPIACFQLEEDRNYHLMRALAQVSGQSGLTDPEWTAGNPDLARSAFSKHQAFLDKLGCRIWASPMIEMSLTHISHWITERAKSGCRVIAVDPITAATQTVRPWIEDNTFLQAVKRTARDYNCSVVLVTHPAKTFSKADMTQLSGGASYARFAQTVIWLETHERKSSRVKATVGTSDLEHNRTVHILKARNARGTGMHLAYGFISESLTLIEYGEIKIKPDKKGR